MFPPSNPVQFGLLHIMVIFALPLPKFVDGTNGTTSFRPIFHHLSVAVTLTQDLRQSYKPSSLLIVKRKSEQLESSRRLYSDVEFSCFCHAVISNHIQRRRNMSV